ncbi:hypothetical protein ACLB2K_031698 [Fragaria x ananassa]
MAGKQCVVFLVMLCTAMAGSASAQSATNVRATYHPLQPAGQLGFASRECLLLDVGRRQEWHGKYGWTAFCGLAGPTGHDACGRCLLVTHRDRSSGDSEDCRPVQQRRAGLGRELALASIMN